MQQISIHALREEGDSFFWRGHTTVNFISIHALREEGDAEHHPGHHRQPISIHALREEGDRAYERYKTCISKDFNPRPPRGGRLLSKSSPNFCSKISIHALREEGDGAGCLIQPCEDIFQSTPSARRATVSCSSSVLTASHFNPRPPRGGRL